MCFLPGTLALGVQNGLPPEHLEIAKNLSKTCREMYSTLTGLAPEIVHFNMIPGTKEPDVIIKVNTIVFSGPDSGKAYCVLKRKVAKMQFLRLFASIHNMPSLNQGSVFLLLKCQIRNIPVA